ncbi:hypothetical protein ESCAB7627_4569 [Escherichia albertii TW07627]|uniref:Uncharacterized protein n=1 Tax=Escherichia albertii (strain TW07627) TaxID=502347 RepID=A0ABC9NRZ1_ESCAT|nr:hypothetical protein ESCAB7627_4569 [Escherichia albertii TW07627]
MTKMLARSQLMVLAKIANKLFAIKNMESHLLIIIADNGL